MDHTWLVLTDLNGLARTRILPNSLGTRSALYPGIFIIDLFDQVIPDVPQADSSRIIEAIPDSTSVRTSPWLQDHHFAFGDGHSEGSPSKICPRQQLKSIIKDLEASNLHVKVGIELEWTLVSPHFSSDDCNFSPIPLQNPSIQEYVADILQSCSVAGIDIESIGMECGRNIVEVALSPQDAIKAADNVQLFKWIAKREANAHHFHATFMPKPYADAAGCGMHVHVSLHGSDASNNFDPFLAGLLHSIRDTSVMYLPFPESYARIKGGFWTCSEINYNFEDRLCMIRIIDGSQKRLELRLGGGDMNPYLGVYAILASGLYGIKENQPLDLEPKESHESIPQTLAGAVNLFMKRESKARKIFGDAFVDHYGTTRFFETLQESSRPEDWQSHYF